MNLTQKALNLIAGFKHKRGHLVANVLVQIEFLQEARCTGSPAFRNERWWGAIWRAQCELSICYLTSPNPPFLPCSAIMELNSLIPLHCQLAQCLTPSEEGLWRRTTAWSVVLSLLGFCRVCIFFSVMASGQQRGTPICGCFFSILPSEDITAGYP